MPIEIEHKFLLKNNDWQLNIYKSIQYQQGYLISDNKRSIRVRISENHAWLNIKSASVGVSRQEYEYEIPLREAIEILNTLCEKPFIEKTRHFIKHKQHTWEIDVFYGENDGLVIAEIELGSIEESFCLPDWAGKEVTYDLRYYNNNLCKTPYYQWKNLAKD
jgi:adenylate cyclase